MTLEGRLLSCVAALAALAQTGWGQSPPLWRSYKLVDGLPEAACASVTVGAQGNVLARHLNVASITRLDGYTVSVVPSPPAGTGRCYESPAGQLWAAAADGVYEFRDRAWLFHSVPEIAAENRAFATNRPQGVLLHPIRQGRVLFLLRAGLMLLNTDGPQPEETETLRRASETIVGEFLGMTPARDGGLWISGTRGLAKLPAPVRSLKADTPWQEFELPRDQDAQNLREPREDESGVTMIAESARNPEAMVVRFDGQRWTVRAAGAERLLCAWSGSEQARWAATVDAVLACPDDQAEFTPDEEIPARRFFDVATDAGGVFWVATSDGLFRHALPIWRTPPAAKALRGPVHCLGEDAEGGLWFVSGAELHRLLDQTRQAFVVSLPARRPLSAVRAVISLASGTRLLDCGDQLFQFHPATGRVTPVLPETPRETTRFLGAFGDGIVCVQRHSERENGPACRLELYDGKAFKPFASTSSVPVLGPFLLAGFRARNGDVWLSGEKGVAGLRGSQWKTYSAAGQNAPESALSFAEAADGRIWCATTDRLWVFNGRDWTLARVGFDHINGLVCSRDDTLWVASNSGLHRLSPAGWIENSVEEGLPSAAVRSVCEDRRGRLWVGTGQGLGLYHPEADADPPRTEISPLAEPRTPEGGSITLSFGAVDRWKLTPRRRLLYSHRLDARDWSPFQEPTTVTFMDLTAGRHSFQVRAMDRNGNVEPKPAQLAFVVALPWFKETRLVAIGALGAAAALFFAALAFNRHLRLRRSYADVERQVAERTRELEIASQELVHSQKMNALGTLAAGIAHDFNNILSIVKGSTQLIEENLHNPAKIRTRLDRIKTVVEQGAGIVQAMLGFSRASDGTPQPCDVNAVVESTIRLLGDRFLRDVAVRFERAPVLPPVPVAKDLVQQVLLNFIFNAAESMPGRKAVVVSTARLETLPAGLFLKPADAPAYVGISVRDSGCGIPPGILPRIFEPFFTTKALSTRRGTGLGLSMAYELARRLNAGLHVESVVNQGSVFTLILPVPDNAPVALPAAPPVSTPTPS
jgi:signal transduction histidine kinase